MEVSFRSPSVSEEDVQEIFDSHNIPNLIGDSPLAAAECVVEATTFDDTKFQKDDVSPGGGHCTGAVCMTLPVQASITSVPVGEELYLRCRENFVMDSKVSPVASRAVNGNSRNFTVRYTYF